ncbi:MAG: amidohydrolase family protein, partial [Bacteroidales bacterium]|nr:amidohydrolase family protein [Bacteroidales bacterium]
MAANATFRGHIVDLVSRRIFGGEINVKNGVIDSITECEVEKNAPYYMPGFIDSHVHIESSMMTPVEFARIALRHGTIGAVCDPHEIANVMGREGIELMLDLSKLADFRFAFGVPSCVPSCNRDIETSGFVLGAEDVDSFMKRDDIYFLAEMMNFPGVIGKDPEVMAKIQSSKAAGKPIDGHAPGLVGKDRESYAAAGISTDHECTSIETGRSAIKCGMIVQIREGSAAKDYEALSPLISEAPGMIMFCTDDCHPNDFIRGHIDRIVRRGISDGYDIMDILTAACLTPVKHYGIP